MALDAVSFMRARVRGTPSWPGHDPETGYVGADRSDHSQKLLADGAGHTFLKAATVSSSLAGWRGRALTCEKPSCLRILPIVRSLFGAICPARGTGAALAMPYADSEAM